MLVGVRLLASLAAILDRTTIGARKQFDAVHIVFRQEAIGTKIAILLVLFALKQVDEASSMEAINASPTALCCVAIFAIDAKVGLTKVTKIVGLASIAVESERKVVVRSALDGRVFG